MKTVWKGSISFGLVNIPVKLYSAIQSSSLDFDMLDSKDQAPIKYKRVNENTQKEVPFEQIVKGFYYNDKYVILNDKDFEAAAPAKSKTIDLEQFVNLSEVDPVYFDSSYYVEPEKNGAKAYSLLLESLKKSKKAGFGRFVLRTTENLVLVMPYQNILTITKIHFPEEVRAFDTLEIPSSKLSTKELEMAMSLINQFSQPLEIEKFKNEYSEQLMKVIKQKANGKTVKATPLKVSHRSSDDLLAQLKASLEGNTKTVTKSKKVS